MLDNLITFFINNKENYEKITLNKNEVLFFENQKNENIYFILKGEINISTNQFNEEIIFNTLKENDIFGNNNLFSKDKIVKGTAFAKKKTKLLVIDKLSFINLLKNDLFLEEYLTYQSNIIITQKAYLRLLKINNLKNKLIYLLKENNNQYKYESINKLSIYLATTRENLSRTLSKLEKENIISVSNKTIFLNNELII